MKTEKRDDIEPILNDIMAHYKKKYNPIKGVLKKCVE
jgi:hypothetical protein